MEAAESRPDWTREVAALRRVARALLADEHAADDVLQEAWLRAHARREPSRRPAAYWKRAVANLARDRRRGESRRAQREAHAARPEALPSTDDVAERLELVQRVARAAAELPEPYRSTIHLHYFEDRSAQEIAASADVPLETVRTRIRRGLERMRIDLDASAGGDRAAWCLSLAPFALRRAPESTLAASAALATTAGGLLAVNKLVIAAAVGLIAVGAIWFATFNDPGAVPLAEGQPTIEALAEPRDVSPAPTDETHSPESAESARTALNAEAATQPAGDGLLDLTGTLTLVEPSGRRRADVDGGVVLEVHDPEGSYQHDYFEVTDGRWSARVPSTVRLSYVGAYVDGHPASPIGDGTIALSAKQVDLEAVPWPRTNLRVIEAATGLDLDQVELRWSDFGHMPEARCHPGEAGEGQIRRTGLSSPFEVELPGPALADTTMRLWVTAPGLAWKHVDVLLSAGGTRTVALEAGGDLEVFPSGPRPGSPWLVALVECSGEPPTPGSTVAWQAAAPGELTRLDRLAPGTYIVRAILSTLRPGLSGSSKNFEIRAGEVTRVSLPLVQPDPGPRVHLRGSLTWNEFTPTGDLVIEPVWWATAQENVVLRPQDMTPDPDRPLKLHWDAGEVFCGEYLAIHDGAGLRQRFDTGTGSDFRIELTLPQQVALIVRVLDAWDGRPLPEARVSWALQRTDDHSYKVWTQEADPAEPGLLRCEVPAVPLVLEVAAAGRTTQRQDVTPQRDGTLELEVRLLRESGLRVRLLEGDAVIPGLYARPRILDPSGERVISIDWDTGRTAVKILLDPGDYRLSFTELGADWRPPGWIDVRVVEGVLTPIDFPLERAP